MADKVVEVKTKMADGWQVTAQIREHHLVIDQPTATNEGPNPLETFLFALSGCISTIAKMAAREQKIELRQFNVELSGVMNPAGLLGQATDDPIGFKQIEMTADIDADLTEAEKVKFLDLVCHRCPIHDNLLNPTVVIHRPAE